MIGEEPPVSERLYESRELPIRPPPRGIDLPTEDGEPMETQRHKEQMDLLIYALRGGWRERRDFYVNGNMFVYYSELQSRRNDFRGPDVFVVLDVDPHERRSWVVWEEEGRRPDVVIEVTSDSTRAEDRGKKRAVCEKVLRVGAYYVYDPFTHELEGWALDGRVVYQPLARDERGHMPCPPLGLELGFWEGDFNGTSIRWLRWFEPKGPILLTAEERRAAEESGRADEATQRAGEETRRADAQARRADEAAQRAGEEARRADAEARRADELAVKLAELERRLGERED